MFSSLSCTCQCSAAPTSQQHRPAVAVQWTQHCMQCMQKMLPTATRVVPSLLTRAICDVCRSRPRSSLQRRCCEEEHVPIACLVARLSFTGWQGTELHGSRVSEWNFGHARAVCWSCICFSYAVHVSAVVVICPVPRCNSFVTQSPWRTYNCCTVNRQPY
jgi:hypothetical protein